MCDLLMSWACCDKMNGENTTPEARMGNITWFFSAFCIRVETILWRRLQKKICQSRKQWIEGAINESMIMRIIWGIITIDYCSMITSKQTTGSWPCAKKNGLTEAMSQSERLLRHQPCREWTVPCRNLLGVIVDLDMVQSDRSCLVCVQMRGFGGVQVNPRPVGCVCTSS